MVRIALAALMIGLADQTEAAVDDGVSLLKVPVTAEAVGLGGVLPMQEGVDAVFANPSGLAQTANHALTLTHAALHADTRVNAVGGAFRLGQRGGTLGLSALTMTQGAIAARNEAGDNVGSVNGYDVIVGLSWAKALERHRVGLGAKHIRQSLASVTASGYAADLGYQYQFSRAVAGVSVQNLGPSMRFIEESFPLPLTISGGLKFNFKNLLSLNAGVAHRPNSNRLQAGFGSEILIGQTMALRAGYLAPFQARSAGSAANLLSHLGFGLGWRFAAQRLKLDYSMIPANNDFGIMHRFTMQLGWGRARASREEPVDDGYYAPFFQTTP